MLRFLRRYRAYLAENPERYWFKRKAYGWGWVPATWEGWLSLVVFLCVYVVIFVPFVSKQAIRAEDVSILSLRIGCWIVALLGLCYVTGEKAKWQWGIPDKRGKH